MLVTLNVCHKDLGMATRLLDWIAELGGCQKHEILLHWNMRTAEPVTLIATAAMAFGKVWTLPPWEEDERGWPWSPNLAWQNCARYIANPHPKAGPPPQPWFWMEPDAVVLSADWLDRIAAEYAACGKPFMGDLVEVEGVARHLSGISVYPPTIEDFLRGDGRPSLIELAGVAWDVFFAESFLPHTAFTKLIQHEFWHSRNPDVEWRFESEEDFAKVRSDAVVFHRDKQGKLLERLKTKRGAGSASKSTPFPRVNPDATTQPAPRPPGTMFTYFSPVVGIDSGDAVKLLDLWSQRWTAQGWSTVVLNEDDARAHPMFAIFDAAISALPSINPPGYDRACFLRWLAMAQAGGGFMSDYDVMPIGFKPRPLPSRLTLFQDHNPCPSLVAGTKEEYERICRWFMAWEPSDYDKAHDRGCHVSDQNVLQQSKGKYDLIDTVKHYSAAGWEKAGAVHFANACMDGRHPRWQHIPAILDSIPSEPSEVEKLKAEIEALKTSKVDRALDRIAPRFAKKKKPKRTPEEQAKIDARMAKARAGRKLVKA